MTEVLSIEDARAALADVLMGSFLRGAPGVRISGDLVEQLWPAGSTPGEASVSGLRRWCEEHAFLVEAGGGDIALDVWTIKPDLRKSAQVRRRLKLAYNPRLDAGLLAELLSGDPAVLAEYGAELLPDGVIRVGDDRFDASGALIRDWARRASNPSEWKRRAKEA